MTDVAPDHIGPAAMAWKVPGDERFPATVSCWFFHAKGQTPAWEHFVLSIIHLRDYPGMEGPAHLCFPEATHEIVLSALVSDEDPQPFDPGTWSMLSPLNLVHQVALPSDEAAVELASRAMEAACRGELWLEPPLSGQAEPWVSALDATAEHYRGEHSG